MCHSYLAQLLAEHSPSKLKRSLQKGSPCMEPRTLSIGLQKSFPKFYRNVQLRHCGKYATMRCRMLPFNRQKYPLGSHQYFSRRSVTIWSTMLLPGLQPHCLGAVSVFAVVFIRSHNMFVQTFYVIQKRLTLLQLVQRIPAYHIWTYTTQRVSVLEEKVQFDF